MRAGEVGRTREHARRGPPAGLRVGGEWARAGGGEVDTRRRRSEGRPGFRVVDQLRAMYSVCARLGVVGDKQSLHGGGTSVSF